MDPGTGYQSAVRGAPVGIFGQNYVHPEYYGSPERNFQGADQFGIVIPSEKAAPNECLLLVEKCFLYAPTFLTGRVVNEKLSWFIISDQLFFYLFHP